MEELISIILPVYNVKEYAGKCIESIINQTYRNIEIIIVDDGSTDGSALICDKYKEIDNRIRVIHQQNAGLSSARNTGLQSCNGNYICFIDSDDYIENNYIEVLYKLIKANNVRISICGIKVLKDGIFSCGSTNLINHNGEIIRGRDCIFNTYVWNKMYDAEIWKNRMFDTGKYYEDIYITYQVMYAEERIAVSEQQLYVYRKRKGSISNNMFDVDKTRDFLDASEQRMKFFVNKEQYLYDKCVERYLGAIRLHYCALYASDKKKYKDNMRKLVKESRKMYFSRIFKSRFSMKEHMKALMFCFMPRLVAKSKYKDLSYSLVFN